MQTLDYSPTLCFVPTVGYIVGLGDRHIQNILIDEQTAELVHIDLGKIIVIQLIYVNRKVQQDSGCY